MILLGLQAVEGQQVYPWPLGGKRGQSLNVANVATWWWSLGKPEQLDVEFRQDNLEKQGSLESLGGCLPREDAVLEGCCQELARSASTQLGS